MVGVVYKIVEKLIKFCMVNFVECLLDEKLVKEIIVMRFINDVVFY